jgi:hypothetical protein
LGRPGFRETGRRAKTRRGGTTDTPRRHGKKKKRTKEEEQERTRRNKKEQKKQQKGTTKKNDKREQQNKIVHRLHRFRDYIDKETEEKDAEGEKERRGTMSHGSPPSSLGAGIWPLAASAASSCSDPF